MLEAIFWGLVGAFIGWGIPQPSWAVNLKNKLMDMFKK
jgi:hypothetical protein